MESAVSTRDTLVRRTLLAASPIDGAAVARAAAAGADAVVLDLARGPAAHRRDEARRVLSERVATLAQSGGETLLWTDAVGVAEDIAACPPGAIGGALVTVGAREELEAVDGALGDWESRHGLQRGVVNVEVVLATAAAVQSCATIAAGSSRVVALALDEQALLRAVGSNGGARRDLATYYRGAVVVAARALGVQAHGAVGQGVGALAAGYAAVGRRMGLRGALCFDADVVALVNSGFSPREGEVEAARRVLAAMDAAIADGRGAIAASAGTMADLANVRQARAVIDRAAAIERRREPPSVDEDTPEPGPTSEEGSAPPWR